MTEAEVAMRIPDVIVYRGLETIDDPKFFRLTIFESSSLQLAFEQSLKSKFWINKLHCKV